MQCHSNLTMRKMCSLILASWIRWHAFSYIFLDGEGTTRKTERRKWLTPHQKISLSCAFNMGTMFKMQVTSLLKQPIFFLKWQTSYLKLNGTQLFQVLVPSPSYLFTVLGGKKKQGRKPGHPYSRWSDKYRFSPFDYGEKHLDSWGNSAGSSCFTFIPYIHVLGFKLSNSNPSK